MHRRHIKSRKLLFVVVSCLAASPQLAQAQSPPPVILAVDLENLVYYWDDVADRAKVGTNPSITTLTPNAIGQLTFQQNVWLADIVAVNGSPVKGTFVTRTQNLNYRPAPVPGQSIADINRSGGPGVQAFEILDTNDTPIGTIWVEVLVGGPPPPGSPTAITGMNGAIVGGTGAFLGARGQCGLVTLTTRSASQTEDPAMRRVNGGGKARLLLYLLPMSRPSIIVTSAGAAVVHSTDFSPVTSTNPAKRGEILSLFATGLGPVRASIDPGSPFPSNPLAAVNSPVKVTIDGVPADVLGAVGYPGSTDSFQVNFRVPTGAVPGTVSLQVSAAWIASPAVNIAVQ